jgi:hypothetical protein
MTLTAEALNAQLGLPTGAWVVPFADYHLIITGHNAPALAAQALQGPAFTLIHNGRIAALWGIVICWPGMAEGWMIGTPELRPIGTWFTYATRRFCAIAAQSLDLHRIQIHVQTSNAAYGRWARAARFEPEAVLKIYTSTREDVYVMARLFQETRA